MDLTPLERAQLILANAPAVGSQWTRGQYRITLTAPIVLEGNMLRFEVDVTKSGIPLPVDNPIYIMNPLVDILDQTGSVNRDPMGAFTGMLLRFAERVESL